MFYKQIKNNLKNVFANNLSSYYNLQIQNQLELDGQFYLVKTIIFVKPYFLIIELKKYKALK